MHEERQRCPPHPAPWGATSLAPTRFSLRSQRFVAHPIAAGREKDLDDCAILLPNTHIRTREQAQQLLDIYLLPNGQEKYAMITLPNGTAIDVDMLETAMEDTDLANRHFLNLVTGEVVFFSEYVGLSEEDERLLQEIDGNDDYVAIERISSHVAYQWMVDFVDELVAPADEQAAETLSIALHGKGAFRRFKDTLHRVDEQWLHAWYQWKQKQLEAALEAWLKSVL